MSCHVAQITEAGEEKDPVRRVTHTRARPNTGKVHTHLTVGALLIRASCPSGSWRDRNWLRSPFSMYSVIIQRGSLQMHTASSRMMLGSFKRDMIFISFRKSLLRNQKKSVITI